MTLLAIALGLYAIGMVGYYKLSRNIIMASEDTREAMETWPRIYKGAIGLMALIWPAMMYWSLVKEASRSAS